MKHLALSFGMARTLVIPAAIADHIDAAADAIYALQEKDEAAKRK